MYNIALGFTAIQSVQIDRTQSEGKGNVSMTVMENLSAAKLYSKVGEHLNLVPGARSLHLDAPLVQLVVHGIPTDISFEDLQEELQTYNPGLVLSAKPRWLKPPETWYEKKASSMVIALSGLKAKEIGTRTRLHAFSTSLRAERKLRFGPTTQCAKCQQFGHHTTKCPNQPHCH